MTEERREGKWHEREDEREGKGIKGNEWKS